VKGRLNVAFPDPKKESADLPLNLIPGGFVMVSAQNEGGTQSRVRSFGLGERIIVEYDPSPSQTDVDLSAITNERQNRCIRPEVG
jgi:hypothetical protein